MGQSESDAGPLSDDEGGAGEDDLSEDEDQAETPAEKRLRIGAPRCSMAACVAVGVSCMPSRLRVVVAEQL